MAKSKWRRDDLMYLDFTSSRDGAGHGQSPTPPESQIAMFNKHSHRAGPYVTGPQVSDFAIEQKDYFSRTYEGKVFYGTGGNAIHTGVINVHMGSYSINHLTETFRDLYWIDSGVGIFGSTGFHLVCATPPNGTDIYHVQMGGSFTHQADYTVVTLSGSTQYQTIQTSAHQLGPTAYADIVTALGNVPNFGSGWDVIIIGTGGNISDSDLLAIANITINSSTNRFNNVINVI